MSLVPRETQVRKAIAEESDAHCIPVGTCVVDSCPDVQSGSEGELPTLHTSITRPRNSIWCSANRLTTSGHSRRPLWNVNTAKPDRQLVGLSSR